jgi:hypothetical protein
MHAARTFDQSLANAATAPNARGLGTEGHNDDVWLRLLQMRLPRRARCRLQNRRAVNCDSRARV